MFRIVEFNRSEKGFLFTIETDDPEELHLITFLQKAHAFSEQYLHRVRIEKKVLFNKEDRPRRLVEASARRQRILTLYETLPGSRRARIKALRAILSAQGDPDTWDGIAIELQLAAQERRTAIAARIRQLRGQGVSFRAIGVQLGIPESSVRTKITKRTRRPQDRRSPSPAVERGGFFLPVGTAQPCAAG